MSANSNTNIWASLWAPDNGDIIKEFCAEVYFGKIENLLIAKAVQDSMRVGDLDTTKMSEEESKKLRPVPKDWILLKSASSLTAAEAASRFQKWPALDLREGSEHGQLAFDWTVEQFLRKYDKIRDILYMVSLPVINTMIATEFNRKYPDFTFSNNRKVCKMEDWCDFLHWYTPTDELPKNEVRAMTQFLIYGMWGSSNFWAEKGEDQILRLLGFVYDSNRMCNGTIQKRKQRGGFVKNHLVKKLDMERTKVREAVKRCFKEWPFLRDAFKQKDTELQGAGKNSGKAKPDKSHLRKYIVHAKRETHGYDGFYLLCEDHPERKQIDGMPTKTKEQEEKEMKEAYINQVTDFLRKQEFATVISDATTNTDALAKLLQNLSGQNLSGKRCPVPNEVNVVTNQAPTAKRMRLQNGGFSSPAPSDRSTSTSVVSTTTTSTSLVSEAASEFSQEKVAQDTEEFHSDPEAFPGIEFNEQFPTSQGRTLPQKQPRVSSGSPSTPQKKSPTKTSERLSPSKPFVLPPLPEGYKCNKGHHNSPNDYACYDNSYFTKAYLTKQAKAQVKQATHCLRCKAEFVSKNYKGLNKNTFKVSGSANVYACEYCFAPPDESFRCNRAFCSHCFHSVQPEGTPVAQV